MPEDSIRRKIKAILCTYVQGNSRLMDEDETGTFHILSFYPEIINTIIEAHREKYEIKRTRSIKLEL